MHVRGVKLAGGHCCSQILIKRSRQGYKWWHSYVFELLQRLIWWSRQLEYLSIWKRTQISTSIYEIKLSLASSTNQSDRLSSIVFVWTNIYYMCLNKPDDFWRSSELKFAPKAALRCQALSNSRNVDTKYQDRQELTLVNWSKVTIFDVF